MPGTHATKRVLVAGGGVAAIELVLALRDLADRLLETEVLAPSTEFEYLPYSVLRPFDIDIQETLDLPALLRQCDAGFRQGTLAGVDPEQQVVTTTDGEQLPYDFLVLALGAQIVPWLPEALTFTGMQSAGEYRELLDELERGRVKKVAYILAGVSTWPLPLYELMLQTDNYLHGRDVSDYQLKLITNEAAPLSIFGNRASSMLSELLERRNIKIYPSRYVSHLSDGHVELTPSGRPQADRTVTLPKLVGHEIDGISSDENGFLRTDVHGHVDDYLNIYAAGDCTDFPLKQGGIATQQADAVAESVAAAINIPLEPTPFRPVLRGMLIMNDHPRYMRSQISGGGGESVVSATRPLWWPPTKIAGKYLAPFLASYAGIGPPPAPHDGVPIDVALAGLSDRSSLEVEV